MFSPVRGVGGFPLMAMSLALGIWGLSGRSALAQGGGLGGGSGAGVGGMGPVGTSGAPAVDTGALGGPGVQNSMGGSGSGGSAYGAPGGPSGAYGAYSGGAGYGGAVSRWIRAGLWRWGPDRLRAGSWRPSVQVTQGSVWITSMGPPWLITIAIIPGGSAMGIDATSGGRNAFIPT